jgi:hypothetical protein
MHLQFRMKVLIVRICGSFFIYFFLEFMACTNVYNIFSLGRYSSLADSDHGVLFLLDYVPLNFMVNSNQDTVDIEYCRNEFAPLIYNI